MRHGILWAIRVIAIFTILRNTKFGPGNMIPYLITCMAVLALGISLVIDRSDE